MRKKNIIYIGLGTLALLLIPIIGMLVSDGWDWGPIDFLAAFVLIFGAGMIYEFFASRLRTIGSKVVVGLIVFLLLALIWVELAVDAVSRTLHSLFLS